MGRRGETRAIVLAYLRTDRDIGQMCRYVLARHGISAGAVRQEVQRLIAAGLIERTAPGRYRRIAQCGD